MAAKSSWVATIIDNLRRVFQVVNERSKRAERETGLTGPQLWAIKTIAEQAPIRVSDLAKKMYVHPATIVGILDRLEARGLAIRSRSTRDRRVVTVSLSSSGRNLVERAPQVAQGLLVEGLEGLSLHSLQSIAYGLQQLVAILGAQGVPPQLILSPEVNHPKKTVSQLPARRTAKKKADRKRPS